MAKEGIQAQVGLLLPLLALVVILVFFLTVAEGAGGEGAGDKLALGRISARSNYCRSIAEFLAGDEFKLGMEATHRILACSAITAFLFIKMERG